MLCRTLEGHAHWVNTLALNCDYVLRIGPCNPVTNPQGDGSDSRFQYWFCHGHFIKAKLIFNALIFNVFVVIESVLQKEAEKNYLNVVREAGERLVSGSDDFTLFLWHPEKEKKHIGMFLSN